MSSNSKGVSGLVNNPDKMKRVRGLLDGTVKPLSPSELQKKLKKMGLSKRKKTLRSAKA